jgi:hypothetical protein
MISIRQMRKMRWGFWHNYLVGIPWDRWRTLRAENRYLTFRGVPEPEVEEWKAAFRWFLQKRLGLAGFEAFRPRLRQYVDSLAGY